MKTEEKNTEVYTKKIQGFLVKKQIKNSLLF